MRYSVFVDHNYHSMDRAERYKLGEFDDCAEAVAACERIVDEFLLQVDGGLSAEQLLAGYRAYSKDPWISSDDAGCTFSSWKYAERRARELAGDLWSDTEGIGGNVCTGPVETDLGSAEIVDRLHVLREPRTFGGMSESGGLDCILRLRDGTALRFRREKDRGSVLVTVILPREHPVLYQDHHDADERFGCASSLLDPRPAFERAIETLREAARSAETDVILGGYGLTELPTELWRLTAITALDLEANWLAELPPEIGRLENLERLSLAFNRLGSLPPEIRSLGKLKDLRLSGNCLAELTPWIGRLRSLQTLRADGNLLSELPPEIFQLPNLSSLTLSKNRLSKLPPDIWRLSGLTRLNLDRNRLSDVPAPIGQLVRLRKLRLEHNRLTALPPEMSRLKNLKDWPDSGKKALPGPGDLFGLTAGGNPYVDIPPKPQGQELLAYLAQKLEARVAAVAWQDLHSDEAGFAIRMPAPPVESRLDAPMKTVRFTAQFEQCRYTAVSTELRQRLDPGKLEQALDRMEADLAPQGSAVVGRKPLKHGDAVGREHVIAAGGQVLRARSYLSPSRSNQVLVEGPPEHAFSAESDRYLDSFRLTPGASFR